MPFSVNNEFILTFIKAIIIKTIITILIIVFVLYK